MNDIIKSYDSVFNIIKNYSRKRKMKSYVSLAKSSLHEGVLSIIINYSIKRSWKENIFELGQFNQNSYLCTQI